MMNGKDLEYFSLEKQVEKSLKTLLDRDRYEFTREDLENTSPREIRNEGLLYSTDGRPAAVKGDIRSVDEAVVDNAASFLEGEFEDEELLWSYSLEDDRELQGAVATFYDPEDPQILDGPGLDRFIIPSSIVQVFGATEDQSQYDISVERYDKQNITSKI
jgi:hypothetical protein